MSPLTVSDQLTALVSQAYQRGENRSCFSIASDQLAVLASGSPEEGFCVRPRLRLRLRPRGRQPSGTVSRAAAPS